MIDPAYAKRMLAAFPAVFTADTNLERISVLFETVFLAPSAGHYTFYVLIGRNTKIDAKVNGKLVSSFRVSIKCTSFYAQTK